MNIDNVEKLVITKDRGYAIFFDYKDKHYLLHECNEDYETVTTLYERKLDINGRYKLIVIKSEYVHIVTLQYKNNKSKVYNQADKRKFVFDLVVRGFVNNKEFNKQISKIKKLATEYNEKIKEYTQKYNQTMDLLR